MKFFLKRNIIEWFASIFIKKHIDNHSSLFIDGWTAAVFQNSQEKDNKSKRVGRLNYIYARVTKSRRLTSKNNLTDQHTHSESKALLSFLTQNVHRASFFNTHQIHANKKEKNSISKFIKSRNHISRDKQKKKRISF